MAEDDEGRRDGGGGGFSPLGPRPGAYLVGGLGVRLRRSPRRARGLARGFGCQVVGRHQATVGAGVVTAAAASVATTTTAT